VFLKMKELILLLSVMLLTSCAVLDYKPIINSAGDPKAYRITTDLQECKELAKQSAVNASSGSRVPIKVRFKNAYDHCLEGRGHKVVEQLEYAPVNYYKRY
jgi:hypothetical protein